MNPDLTRFDFYVNRFLNSYPIAKMSSAEVGQYIFLICHSFLSGKDGTLPDDPEYLAGLARTDQVSEKVLAMFPLVDTEWGPRRCNETIQSEYRRCAERKEFYAERSKKGSAASASSRASSSASGQLQAEHHTIHTKPSSPSIPVQPYQPSQVLKKKLSADETPPDVIAKSIAVALENRRTEKEQFMAERCMEDELIEKNRGKLW